MAKATPESVDEYIARHPQDVQATLRRVRSVIRKALPGAEEVISYQIPAYRLHDRCVIYFAGWKQHYSLYPASAGLVAAFRKDLAPYPVSKGTIRFPLGRPVPGTLIAGIAKFLARRGCGAPEGEAGQAEEGPLAARPLGCLGGRRGPPHGSAARLRAVNGSSCLVRLRGGFGRIPVRVAPGAALETAHPWRLRCTWSG